jgi:hypothetical protein
MAGVGEVERDRLERADHRAHGFHRYSHARESRMPTIKPSKMTMVTKKPRMALELFVIHEPDSYARPLVAEHH